MRKFYIAGLTLFFLVATCHSLLAQNNFFSDAGENAMRPTNGQRVLFPQKYRASTLNVERMQAFLWSLPSERNVVNRNLAPVMEIPMPDGKMARFRVWESSIMEPALAAKFPQMKTFAGQGIDDPYATIRFDFNPYFGFSAQIISVNGRVYIDPYARYDLTNYVSYSSREYHRDVQRICHAVEDEVTNMTEAINAGPCRGTQLYTYRLALACTGEYAVRVCLPNPASVPVTAAAMLTSVNRVSGVYETEVAVRMVLVGNNNDIIYLDGTTDPYTNNSGGTMLGQNQANLDLVIGTANYDIGHVFSTGGGGVATLNSPCNAASKARGVTGLTNPIGDPFDIDYVAHEMGHQFGAPHTFNSVTSSCGGGNRTGSDAYEVGSGTTIMGYAGICGSDDIQPNSDPFFHTISFDRISNFVEAGGAACRSVTPTGNILPVITSMDNNGISIPLGTPFTLTGSATDANGDALTYCWEEWDLGPATAWNGGNGNTTSPLFKSRVPKTSGSRTFPDMAVIIANHPVNPPGTMGGLKGETMATQARALKFRLTVRDNRAGGGGVVTGGDGCQVGFTTFFQVNTVAATGPFIVTAPNGGENYAGGSSQTITWNVTGTDAAPISVANVRITLSTDGGLTYPIVLNASTPNDGSEALIIPGVLSTTARVRIEALGNIFFDISNGNFTISAPVSDFSFANPPPTVAACPAPATMDVSLGTFSNNGFSTPINLTFANNPAGTNVLFAPNPVTPGNTTIVTLTNTNTLNSGTYVITVTGTAGSIIRTRDITYTINTGTPPTINTHPASQTICSGSNVTFSVAATGVNLTYAWQVSVNGGGSFTNIPGASALSYTITGVTPAMNNNQYRVIVTGQCGSVTSTAATLTVTTAPTVTTHPVDITLCAGSNHTFTVAATGSNLTYQWELSTNGGGSYAPIANGGIYSGATTASLTLTGITAPLNNNRYRVVVSGSCPPPATSNGAILTVVTSVTITTQPSDAVVCAGGNTSFTVAGSGVGIIYQWQVSTDGGANYTNITDGGVYSGATAATLNITGATTGMNNYRYRAQLSNATCPTPGVSSAAILTINTLPGITGQPSPATICVGGSNTFSVTGGGTGVSYQWQVSTAAVPAFTNIAGATASTYAVTNATAIMNGNQYRVIVSGTCLPAITSTAVTLTVISPVVITTQPANQEVCATSTATFSVSSTSMQPEIYQWQVSTTAVPAFTNIAGATSSSLALPAVPTSLNGNKYRVLVSNATCTTPTISSEATLTVRALPTSTLAATTTSLLPGQSSVLTATGFSSGGTLVSTWLHNGIGLTNTGNILTVNIDSIGDYQIRIRENWTSGLSCTNFSNIVTISASTSTRLFVFPSPNQGEFTVAFYNASLVSTQQSIAIYDSKGTQVYNQKLNITGPYRLHKIDLRPAGRGIYYVVIGDANGKKLADTKMIIQ